MGTNSLSVSPMRVLLPAATTMAPTPGLEALTTAYAAPLGWAKIIRPATVWRTRVTMTSNCSLR